MSGKSLILAKPWRNPLIPLRILPCLNFFDTHFVTRAIVKLNLYECFLSFDKECSAILIYRQILSLSWPILLEMTAQTTMNNLNVWVVSHLGSTIVASVGLTGTLIAALGILLSIVGLGATVLIAQFRGANQPEKATAFAVDALRLMLVIATLLTLLLIAGIPVWFAILHVPSSIVPTMRAYMTFMAILLPFSSWVAISGGILRSFGATRVVFYQTLLVIGVTAFFNLLFVTGLWNAPRLGLTGLYLANVSGIMAGVIYSFLLLARHLPVPVTRRMILHGSGQVMAVLRVGLPSALELGSYQFTQFFLVSLIARLGTNAIATRVYAISIESASFLFGLGIAQGVSILVGHEAGKGAFHPARRIAWSGVTLGVGGMSLLALLLFIFAHPLIALFTTDKEVVRLGARVLQIIALAQPAKALNMIIGGALRGAGDNRWLMWNSGMFVWISVLAAWLFGFPLGLGLAGIWWGMCVDEWVRAALLFSRLRGTRWENRQFTRVDTAPETAVQQTV
ncbi:hypothetical protein ATW55_10180 [Ferroacidibacillus organovorans]|uniref:Probable multidrug resistance protein NorM n=1 Tax=Ferroacidibacillus organovorans TaxID=1765683 RepID=A0A101XNQ4_9BACL|nr:hypothetical protein ATW55_10180 [Ferroacidibacillus organovorans]